MIPAKTLEAIDATLYRDQCSSYRRELGLAIKDIGDAFDPTNKPFRRHLGASVIGRECERELWYAFHWAAPKQHQSRLLRLFNRGHMEEARFVAMLRACGYQVWTVDPHGKQFRLSTLGGHFGGSLDAVIIGLPDVAAGIPVLGEFKTHNEASFSKLTSAGLLTAKFEHYVQMQLYMHFFKLSFGLYLAVNKNNDELHAELVDYREEVALRYLARASSIIQALLPPTRVSKSAGWYICKTCDYRLECHQGRPLAVNCRTCHAVTPHMNSDDGAWRCGYWKCDVPAAAQEAGCERYTPRV